MSSFSSLRLVFHKLFDLKSNIYHSREMNFMTSISSNENERLVSLAYNEQNERCSLINSTPVDVACIGKKKNVFSKY